MNSKEVTAVKTDGSRAHSGLLTLILLLSFLPTEVRPQGLQVNCDSGGTISGALATVKPGDTLTVSGTCNEGLVIAADVARLTLDGRGTATIRTPTPAVNVIAIQGREITIRGFTVSGGNNGIVVQRGGTALVDGNTIRGNASNGILVGPQASASIINNTIENNLRGISVDENSSARIGFQVPTVLGLPNTIQNNADDGIPVLHNSSARIVGATIRNNGGHGVLVERASHVDLSDNIISGNQGNGITVSENSGVNLDLGRIQAVAPANRTDAANRNGRFGIDCSLGSYVSGSLGTLGGARGAMQADSSCIQGQRPIVGRLSFDPATVAPGGTFAATFSGTNLSAQTFFDVRFRTPGSNSEQEAFNWQQGTSATHIAAGTLAGGIYLVTAVRAHAESADHSGPYIPVSASLTVRP